MTPRVTSSPSTTAAKVRFWINTVSLSHVRSAVEGGFTQADHGKNTRLRRLSEGDWLVFYSPRTEFCGGRVLQAFTAIGRVADSASYQVEMTPDFHPWRRRVAFFGAHEAPVRPLVDDLDFITDKRRWGYPFRRGLFEVEREGFRKIAEAMGVKV